MTALDSASEIDVDVNPLRQPAKIVFVVGLVALGILALIYGDFALVWQPVPKSVPARELFAYASGLLMLVSGTGLLFKRTATVSVRILFAYLLLWLLLKVPGIVVAPQIEEPWLGFGEIAVLFAGGWVLFANLASLPAGSKLKFATGESGTRIAQLFFAIWLVPIGLSHFLYMHETVALMPAWLPYKNGWAYLTGAGHIAAGLGVFFSVLPWLAATMEAAMLSVITFLVWVPVVATAPTSRLNWTAFIISWAITAGAWVIAGSFTRQSPVTVRHLMPTGSRASAR
jgi:uncharacterized membrane protein